MEALMARGDRLKIFISAGFCIGLTPIEGSAQELLPPVRDPFGVRSWGLGIPPVALSGLSHGETALDNPAWVGEEGKAKGTGLLRGLWFPSMTFGANGTTKALAKAYFSGESSAQRRIENFLKASKNEQTPYASFSIRPAVTLGLLQWVGFTRVRVEGFVWQPAETEISPSAGIDGIAGAAKEVQSAADTGDKLDVRATIERGTSLSVSVPYKNTGVHLGLTVRPTWRSDYFGSVSLSEPLVAESAGQLKAKFNETRGVPIDAGMAVRLQKIQMKPILGLKLEDVSDTRFNAVNPSHQTLVQKSNLSAGVSGWLIQSSKFGTQCTVAGSHLNDGRLEWAGKWGGACEIHLGGQLQNDLIYGAPVLLRVGVTQDGVAYGINWDMPFALLEMGSSLARVTGPAGYSTRSDRRYFMRLTVDANQP